MITANFSTYSNYVTDSLHQWDINQTLRVTGLNLATAPEVHFSNVNTGRAVVRQATLVDGVITVSIPNSLLQDPLRIKVHIGIYEGDAFKIVEEVQIPVKPRKRPEDYAFEDTDGEVYSFKRLENQLNQKASSARVDNIIAAASDTGGNAELVDLRTNMHGRIYGSAGEALRTELNRSQPVFSTLHNYFNYDTEAKTLTYVDANAIKLVNVFEGESSKVVSFTPSAKVFNVGASPGVIMYLVANLDQNTLRLVGYKDYTFAAQDYMLLFLYQYKIYPMALSPLDIKVDGKPFAENYDTDHTIRFIEPVQVSRKNCTLTLPATYPYFFKNASFTVGSLIPEAVTVSFNMDTDNLQLVVFNAADNTITVKDRKHKAADDEYVLMSFSNGYFTPIELGADCIKYVDRVGGTGESVSLNDMIAPMVNASKTFKIVLGGDSITHGVGGTGFAQDGDVVLATSSRTWRRNTSGYCWAKLFKEYIEANFNATVTNNGCTGSNSGTWAENKSTLIPVGTDLLILTVGTNDRNGSTGVTTREAVLNTYYANLRGIVEYCHVHGTQVILVSPIPASAANEAEEGRLCHVYELAGVVQKVAAEYGLEYINMYNEVHYFMADHGLNIDDYFTDGLHPDDALYRILFYRYLKALNLAPSYTAV